MGLYSTTGEDDIKYLSDKYKSERDEGEELTSSNIPPIKNSGYRPSYTKFGVIDPRRREGVSMDDWEDEYEGFTGSLALLEKYKRDRQSGGERAFNTFAGGIISGLGTFLETTGYLADLNSYAGVFGNTAFDDKFGSFLAGHPNSLFAKALQKLGKGMKDWTEDVMPIYEKQSNDIFDNVVSWRSGKGIIDSALGFVLAGFGAGTAVKFGLKTAAALASQGGKAAEGFMLAKKIADMGKIGKLATEGAYKMARTEAYVNLLSKVRSPKTMQFLQSQGAGFMTKIGESMIEGVETYESTLNMLDPLVRSGKLTRKEAMAKANEAANHAFDMTKWTWALDAYMLKGMFKPASISGQKVASAGFQKTMKNVGQHLLGAPKEGFEESWQEAARMEGMLDAYKQVQAILDTDEDLQMKKTLGFNPNETASSFAARTVQFMTSKQGQIAGWIGAISGPLQSFGVSRLNAKETAQNEKKQRDKQTAIIESNKQLFGPAYTFAAKVKDFINTEDFKASAALTDDKTVEDLASEVLFVNQAVKNMELGIVDELEVVLNSDTTGKAAKFKPLLEQLKTDFVSAKKYANAGEVLGLQQTIRMNKKLIDHYETKMNSTEITPEQKTDYAKGITTLQEATQAAEAKLKEVTSMKYQVELFSEENKNKELMEILSTVDEITDMNLLQNLYKQYKHPDIKNRIEVLKKETKAKEGVAPKPASAEIANIETQNFNLNKGTLFEYKGKTYTIDSYETNDKGSITKLTFQEKNSKGVPASITFPEGMHTSTIEAGLKGAKQTGPTEDTVPKLTMDQATQYLDHVIATFNKDTGAAFTTRPEDYQKLIDIHTEAVNTGRTEKEVIAIFNQKLQDEIIAPKLKSTPEVENIEIAAVEKTQEAENIVAKLATPLGDTTEDIEILELFDPDEVSNKEYSALKEAYVSLLSVASQIFKPIKSFKDFMDYLYFTKADRLLLKDQNMYDIRRRAYSEITGIPLEDIPDTYDKLYGIEQADYIEPGTPDFEASQEGVTVTYIDPKDGDKVSTAKLYQQEVVQSTGKKNRFGVVSFAYLSLPYQWVLKKLKGETIAKRESTSTEVDKNPILNPNKFNAGDPIYFSLNDDPQISIRLSSGKMTTWGEVLKAHNSGEKTWKAFLLANEMQIDEVYTDYFPISISSPEHSGVAHVHDVGWQNHHNIAGNTETIENNKKVLREFRKRLIAYLKANPDKVVNTVVEEKALEVSERGGPLGFNIMFTKENPGLTSERLPDPDLKFGFAHNGNLTVPGSGALTEHVLNSKELASSAASGWVFMPLGKKGGKMKYWAQRIMNHKLGYVKGKETTQTNDFVRGIRQAIEIFIKQDLNVNPELYQAYKQGEQSIDLLTEAGLNALLNKIFYMTYASKNIQDSVAGNKERTAIQLGNGILRLATNRANVANITLVKKDSKLPENKDLDALLDLMENQMLTNLLFNVNASLLNNAKNHRIVNVKADNAIEIRDLTYNELLKENSTVTVASTELTDGSYAYTHQHVVKFDFEKAMQNIPVIQEVKQKETNLEKTELTSEQKMKLTQEAMDKIVENQEFIQLSPDQKYYINQKETAKRKLEIEAAKKGDLVFGADKVVYEITEVSADSKPTKAKNTLTNVSVPIVDVYTRKYKRVTDEGVEFKETPESVAAVTFGTKVDSFVRDFFSRELKPLHEYTFATPELLTNFIQQLEAFKESIKDHQILAKGVIVFDDALEIAGELDMITRDTQGNLHIFDFKTMKDNNFKEHYSGETVTTSDPRMKSLGVNSEVNKFYSKKHGESKAEKYTKQLSKYNILIARMYGVSASSMSIIPIVLKYSVGDNMTNRLELVEFKQNNVINYTVPLTIQEKVSNMKLGVVENQVTPTKQEVEELSIDPDKKQDAPVDKRIASITEYFQITEKDLRDSWETKKDKVSWEKFVDIKELQMKNAIKNNKCK